VNVVAYWVDRENSTGCRLGCVWLGYTPGCAEYLPVTHGWE